MDKESARAVSGWLRLADRVAGRKPVEGHCDSCGGMDDLSVVGDKRLCAACGLDSGAAAI